MKKLNELKKNVNKFCQDHILGITATAAAGIWIAYFAWTIHDIKNSYKDTDTDISSTGSSTYEIDPDKIRITVPDDVSIDDVIEWIKENDAKWIKAE